MRPARTASGPRTKQLQILKIPVPRADRGTFCERFLFPLVASVVFTLAYLGVSASAGPPVAITLLDGSTRTGELEKLTNDQVDIMTDQGAASIPGDQLMLIDFTAAGDSGEPPAIGVTFADHSTLRISAVESDGTNVTLSVRDLPSLTLPIRQLHTVRLATLDDKISARWDDLVQRNARDDLLVIRKGDVLDYVAGSVGRITPESVTILVRGKELSAPRDKLFGLIFASRTAPSQTRRIAVRTRQGSVLQAETVLLDQEGLQLTTASLGKVTLPLSQIESLDFGGGRIRYLADLAFDQSGSKSPHEDDPVVWFVCRNAPAGSGGRSPLQIGQKEYRKGLWLHSGAVLRFRLNREYTRLRSTAGFDLTHIARMPRFNPQVKLVVMGDGKELYSKEFHWNDSPDQLDLNLTDVRELTIRVDSAGSAQGILEHFALGDAQVIQ